MRKGGFIKLHRGLLESPIMSHDGLTRLWLFCLLRAGWKDSKWLIPGTLNEIVVPRGSFVTGRSKLHKHLYGSNYKGEKRSIPSELTVWRWLLSLSRMGCISVTNMNNRCSMVSICNYSTYQKREAPSRTTDEQPMNNRRTTDEQLMNTVEEGKNIRSKEGKKNTYTHDFEEFWKDYPRRQGNPPQGKANAFEQWRKLPPEDIPQVMLALKHYTKSCNGYPKDPERFLKKDFWKDHLTPPTQVANHGTNKPRNGPGQLFDPSTVF